MNGQGQGFHSGGSGLHPSLIHVCGGGGGKLTGRTTPQSA